MPPHTWEDILPIGPVDLDLAGVAALVVGDAVQRSFEDLEVRIDIVDV